MAAFDLDAARAARTEAVGEEFTFSLGGEEFTIPPASDWPISVSGDFAEGRLDIAMRGLLGEEAYRRFAPKARLGDLELIFNQVGKTMGVTLPNSSPPLLPGSTPT